MKKFIIVCLSLVAFSFTAKAQLIDNHIAIETKTVAERTYIEIVDNMKKDVNQDFYHITWKMDGQDIDIVIPMEKVEFLDSTFEVNYIEFEFDFDAVQEEIVDISNTIAKVKIYG